MRGRLADDPEIGPAMTGGTGPAADSNPGMVERSPGKRCCRQVTGFAGSGGREMVRRFGDNPTGPVHAGRMTTGTAGRDPRMIH